MGIVLILAFAALAVLTWALILLAMFLNASQGEEYGDLKAFHEAFGPKSRKRTIDLPPESPYKPANGATSIFRWVPPSSVTPGGVDKAAKSPGEANSK